MQKTDGTKDGQLIRELTERFHRQTEIQPNRILFHDAEEIRRLQGVGVLIKDLKIVDHRPRTNDGAAKSFSPPPETKMKPELAKSL